MRHLTVMSIMLSIFFLSSGHSFTLNLCLTQANSVTTISAPRLPVDGLGFTLILSASDEWAHLQRNDLNN